MSKKARFAFSLISLEVVLLPYLLAFLWLLKETQTIRGLQDVWLSHVTTEPIGTYLNVLSDPTLLKTFLLLQVIVGAFLLQFLWRPENKVLRQKKRRLREGVGGPEAAGDGQHGTSRWQTEEELDASTTVWYTNKPPQETGLVIGMRNAGRKKLKVWKITRDGHNLIIGATRSGKSRRLVLPSIWSIAQKGESMILSDPKGELYARSHKYLRERGYEVVMLDFRNPKRGNYWNLMDPIIRGMEEDEYARASEAAWDIAHTIVHQKQHNGDPIWANGQESIIAALMQLVAAEAQMDEEKHLHSVYTILSEMGETIQLPNGMDYNPLLQYLRNLPMGHVARMALATARVSPEKMRSSFLGGATVDLRLFADPSIARMTSKQDHDLAGPGRQKTAVFMIIPDEKSTRHVLATLYVSQTYEALVQLANQNHGRLPVRVHYLLDEFGNLPPVPDFGTKITVSAGRGILFNLIIQDLGQIRKKYKDDYTTIIGNCQTWIYLLTRDIDTAKQLSEMTGKYTVATQNHSANVQTKSISTGYSSGLTSRPLLMPDEILRFPQDQALVLQARQFPAITPLPDLSFWPADGDLEEADDHYDKPITSEPVRVWIPGMEESDETPLYEYPDEPERKKKSIFDEDKED
ncbi:type IV secretory system conjugative DNA transfer family protein [Brevibacillus humidisoli]|uniref:VirD4-like conjugal transfer protein, CD1115 family n=1 Tax=Brevibacillus humidisoli TaxID=2895522 RepID=UPI001E43242B|nr:type IV secretory system conjugative DNA transfer family protein [Brevibacillus humidisoli]UFJ41347.1 type IV secretory system conjugative DNA transfer family protein [Brevibacillus humidisoli]